jgi:hypothetical protein
MSTKNGMNVVIKLIADIGSIFVFCPSSDDPVNAPDDVTTPLAKSCKLLLATISNSVKTANQILPSMPTVTH